jgi:Protein of unknown function (DUF2793)
MANSIHLDLPFISESQAQKHVTHNEALKLLDALVQLSVLDRDLATPPGSPTNGDRYLIAASPTGSWSGQAGKITAYLDGVWTFFTPSVGWICYIVDESLAVAWNGTAWGSISSGSSIETLPKLGINATADLVSRLSINAAATLLNHDGNGHQLKLNKNGAGDTVSLLFQTGFSGRAEMGTTGDEDFHFKVSPDGSSWVEALSIDKDTGELGIPNVDTPTVPSTDRLKFYAGKVSGRMLPSFLGPDNSKNIVQPFLGMSRVAWWNPSGNLATVPGIVGMPTLTALGTATARNVATTNRFTRARRLGYVSAATAAALAGIRSPGAQYTVGDGAGLGGFFFAVRFGISDAAAVAGARMFVGITNSVAAPTNVEPSTLTQAIGVGHGAADTNLQLFYGGSTAQASINLGVNFPTNTRNVDLYNLLLFSPANELRKVYYEVTRLNTGDKVSGSITGTAVQVPSETTLLSAINCWRTNNATLLAVGIDIAHIYVESLD